MEKVVCFMFLVVSLFPNIQANLITKVPTDYALPGGKFKFKCSAGNPTTVNFFRSDVQDPVCSVRFDGFSCKGVPISSRYQCGCYKSDMSNTYLRIYNVNRTDVDKVKWRCGNANAETINLLYPSYDEACPNYQIMDKNVSYGGDCSEERGFNKICVNSNTVCSEVSKGVKKCLCDRNYGGVNGQCKSVPSKLFKDDFVNKTIFFGENVTIEYNLTVPRNHLNQIQVDITPASSTNIDYIMIQDGIRVRISNTDNLLLETFMIRMKAEYGGVKVQDSTLVHLNIIEPDMNVTLGDKCGIDEGVNKICVNKTICSEVSKGVKKCLCDRNYGGIEGQCISAPNKLFTEGFVKKNINSPGKNITIEYNLTVPRNHLNQIQVDFIPASSTNIDYIMIQDGIRVRISNTDNLSLETFMIRMKAEYGGVTVQDSTLVHLNIIEPVIADCTTVIPQQPGISNYSKIDVTNVTLGDGCEFDENMYKICVTPHTVCTRTEQICQCERDYAEIEEQCVELPNALFSNEYRYFVIFADKEPYKIINFNLNVLTKYLKDIKLESIPKRRNIKTNGIVNDQVQVIVNNTKSLQSEVILLKLEATYGGVKIHDSMLFKLEIVINQTFDSISIVEEKPNRTKVGDFARKDFKDFEFVDCPQFAWKNTTILTNQVLDRDMGIEEYNCRIKATFINDNQCTLKDVGTIRIVIEDINDNPPVFSRSSYFGMVEENDPEAVLIDSKGMSVQINTNDRDTAPNSNITYSILNGDDLPFSITNNNRDAIIKVKTNFTIDRETKDEYKFEIEASDGINKNSTMVTVQVIDVNEPAKFEMNKYIFNVSEDDSNVFVGNVYAFDEDKDEKYRKNKYQILSGSFGYFEIDQNGSLSLVNTARQKQTLIFELVVSVTDESLPPEESMTTNVTIHVTDVNESPKFNLTSYNFLVLEGDDCKTKVGQVFANEVDFEGTPNSIFTFSLESSLFEVDPHTGNITCKDDLDYEKNKTYEFEVKAVDQGSPPLTSTTKVLVELIDDNDHYPLLYFDNYTKIFCSNIRKKDKPITVVKGVDLDSGSNGQLTFSITMDNTFGIDSDTGLVYVKEDNNLTCNQNYTLEITCRDKDIVDDIKEAYPSFSISNTALIVNGTFDRENKGSYSIILKANLPSNERSDIALLKVHINDVNDNEPVIVNRNSISLVSLNESEAIGGIVARVEASDADEGKNAQIEFRILTPDVPFVINNVSGNITVSENLDREKKYKYVLQVDATDGKFTDSINITVEIRDVNDNPPIIQSPGTKIINVTEKSDHQAIPINVTDKDSIGNIVISLNKNCPLILDYEPSVEIATGELKFKESLDYEEQTKYECVITATDGKHITNRTFGINVVDANDNSPVFHQIPPEIKIADDMNPGEILVDMINATDADSSSNGKITFSVEPKEYYTINATTGKIRLKLKPDDSSLAIIITATDGGIPPRSAVAMINVTIEYKRPRPNFIGLRDDLKVSENKIYQNLYTVKANISNITLENGPCEFMYSIKGDTNFEIDEKSGNISLPKALDREELSLDRQGRLGLVIVAECGGLTNSTTLFITVEDVNDNLPKCEQQPPIEIFQSSDNVTGKVEASDNDEENNGIQTYHATSTSEYFSVDQKTGAITLKKKFQISRKSIDYKFDVAVSDPTYATVCNITITVKPDNFNGPVFSKSIYTTTLDIAAKKGEMLVVNNLKASDKDNDTITYSLESGEGYFRLNSSTYGPIITLTSDIEVDVQTTIVLKVYAIDDVPPIKTGTCTIQIKIEGQLCLQEALYKGVIEDADTATLFQILFYSIVSALSICVVLLVMVCYKWRTSNRDKTTIERLYKNVYRRPYYYDDVPHSRTNTGYTYATEDDQHFDSVLEPYHSPQPNPIYVRASLMERARFDNLSPRSAVMFDEPPPDYM